MISSGNIDSGHSSVHLRVGARWEPVDRCPQSLFASLCLPLSPFLYPLLRAPLSFHSQTVIGYTQASVYTASQPPLGKLPQSIRPPEQRKCAVCDGSFMSLSELTCTHLPVSGAPTHLGCNARQVQVSPVGVSGSPMDHRPHGWRLHCIHLLLKSPLGKRGAANNSLTLTIHA